MPRFRNTIPKDYAGHARLRADLLSAQQAYQSLHKDGTPSNTPLFTVSTLPLFEVQTIQCVPPSPPPEPAELQQLLTSLQLIRSLVEEQGTLLQRLVNSGS